MLADDVFDSKEGSILESDSFLEEFNKPILQYRKKLRQVEVDHKKEKAVLEQKIELLELQLREFDKREGNMKKMNQDILSTLETFDKKGGDSYLMSKVSEELALINKEKLDEVKQQKTKMKVLRDKLQVNTLELTEKLEKSEERARQLQLEHDKEKIRYEREIDLEKRNSELMKKELEDEKRRSTIPKTNDKSEKQIAILEEENRRLKAEHEAEIRQLRSDFQKNLEELREIHSQEKISIEDRLKKTKEAISQLEESNDTKLLIESQLANEVTTLKEQLAQADEKHNEEMIALKADRDTVAEKCKELEKRIEEFMNISQDNTNFEKSIISLRKSSVKGSTADRSKKSSKGKLENSDKPCEQEQNYSVASSIDIDPRLSALAYSEIQDVCDSERKRIPSSRSQSTMKEGSRALWKETPSKNHNNRDAIRSSNENTRQDLPNQSSVVSFVEFDNQKSILTSMVDFNKQSEIDHEHRGYPKEQDFYFAQDSMNQPQALQNRCINQTSQDIADYSYRLQYTNQHQSGSRSSLKPTKDQGRYRNKTEFDELSISCLETVTDTEFNPITIHGLTNQNKTSEKTTRRRLEAFSGCSMNSEDLRRNFNILSLDNNTRMQGRLRELTGATELLTTNPSTVETSYQRKVKPRGTTAVERRSFERGIYDVMNGLLNIRSKIEKQQENLITAKNESLLHIHSRTRSYSNMGLPDGNVCTTAEPSYMAAQAKPISTATNFYGDLDISRRVSLVLPRNERVVVKDPSYMMVNLSFDGTRRVSENAPRGIQSDYKSRNPVHNRQRETSDKIGYRNRHRNSLA